MRPPEKFWKLTTAVLLSGTLAACSIGVTGATSGASSGATSGAASGETVAVAYTTDSATVAEALDANADVHQTEDTWDTASEVAITLTGESATADSDAVQVDGGTVTITAAGTYRISGTLTDGQIVVEAGADDVVRLVLDGAEIASSTTAAIAVLEADDAIVVLADGTTNSLTDGAGYAGSGESTDEVNAALYSTADLTITGSGALSVTGRSNDGITGKDGLVISGGEITVTAVDDGVRGKDYLVHSAGTLTVTAQGDGLLSDADDDATAGYIYLAGGTRTITAQADGIEAATDVLVGDGTTTIDAGDDGVHAEAELVIGGGALTVASSTEGLEGAAITLAGGRIDATSWDDGINVTGDVAENQLQLTISGGTTTVDAGGDGLDSNGYATMSGGTVVVSGPVGQGNGSIDVNGTFDISGGTLLAAGSAGMAEAPETSSEQAWVSARFDQALAASTVVQLVADDGTVIASYTLAKDAQSVVFSSAAIEDGATYSVVTGGSASGTSVAGLVIGGATAGSTQVATVTEGEHTGGGMGGGRGQRPPA